MEAEHRKSFEENRKILFLCLFSSFAFGLVAHAYGLLNNIFSHDSLNALYADAAEQTAKISVGRFLVPVVRLLRGPVAIPWVIGIIAIAFIGLSVYVTVRMLNINSKPAIVFISGIMVTNITVTAIVATYVHEFDIDMLALLLSCLAAYYWKKADSLIKLLPAAVLSVLSMALYQSYVQVTIVLIIISLISDTLNGENPKKCFLNGVKGAATVGIAVGIYFALERLLLRIFSVSQIDRVDLFSEYKRSLFERAYLMLKNISIAFLSPSSVIPTALIALINLIIFISIVVMIFVICKRKGLKAGNTVFALFLFGLMIVSMNFVGLLSHDETHDVMRFSYWFVYILAIALFLMCSVKSENKFKKISLFVLTAVLIWDNILVSNTAYLKKDLEVDVTLTTFNRVLSDLEDRDDYKAGETEIAFYGFVDIEEFHPSFENISRVIGLYRRNSIGSISVLEYYCSYEDLFKYYFNYPVNISGKDFSENETVASMPSFPEKGYIENIDGVLVVKMGNGKEGKIEGSNIKKSLRKIAGLFTKAYQ